MDISELAISIMCLSILIAIPSVLFYIRKLLNNAIPDMIAEQKAELKAEIEQWFNSEKGQKTLYLLGALIAQGAKDSLPIIGKGGKFKWTDLVAQIAGKYLGITPEGQTESTQPKDLRSKIGLTE